MIYIGNNKIGSVAIGDAPINKIYKGSELVFQKSKPLLYVYNKMNLYNYELYETEYRDLYNDYMNDINLQKEIGKALYDKYKNSTNLPEYVSVCRSNLILYKPEGYTFDFTYENEDNYTENGKLVFSTWNSYMFDNVIPNEFAVSCDWPDGYIDGVMYIFDLVEIQEAKMEDYIFI